MTDRATRRRAWSGLAVVAVLSACGGSGGVTGGVAAGRTGTWEGATPLSEEVQAPSGLVSDGTVVLFTSGLNQAGDKALRSAPLVPTAAPAASRILATAPGGEIPNGPIALAGGDVYVASGIGVVKVAVATGAATRIVDGRPTGVSSIAVDGHHVWWTTSGLNLAGKAEVARMPLRGGPVEVLAAGRDKDGHVFRDEPERTAVAVSATAFRSIVLDGDGAFVATPSGILRVAPGRPPVTVSTADQLGGPPTRLAIDADRLYGEAAGARQALFSVGRGGGAPTPLATEADDTSAIAVAGPEVLFFVRHRGAGGRADLAAVPTTGGPARVLATGPYAGRGRT